VMARHTRRTVLTTLGWVGMNGWVRPGRSVAREAYRKRVLDKHPLAFWPLDETQGPVAHDSAGGAHPGEYRGGVVFQQSGPPHVGREGAVGLNGMNAFVEVADSDVFSQPTSGKGLSVEVWFRPDLLTFPGQTADHYIHWLGKGQAGEFEWGFRFYSQNSSRPNRVSAYIWNKTSAPGVHNEGAGAYFQDALEQGVWVHVVACFDPGDASDPRAGVWIYKNGVLRHGPQSSPGARYAAYNIRPEHGSAPLRLGTRDLGSFLTGGLADVAIYPRVLSASEIADNSR
jgi:hypothetical protein